MKTKKQIIEIAKRSELSDHSFNWIADMIENWTNFNTEKFTPLRLKARIEGKSIRTGKLGMLQTSKELINFANKI